MGGGGKGKGGKVPCRFYAQGYCKNGKNCTFLHPGADEDGNHPPNGGDNAMGMDGMGASPAQPTVLKPLAQANLPPPEPVKPLDMIDEVDKFCEKYELEEEHKQETVNFLKLAFEDRWPQDLRELDHSLSRARNPSSLLGQRLREMGQLRALEQKSKSGHLPGCMCPSCRETSFARAVGVRPNEEGSTEETSATAIEKVSLNAAALAAYQAQQEDNPGGPAEEVILPLKAKGKGKTKAPLVMPTGTLVNEVRTFCLRFSFSDVLSTKCMNTLQKRTDEQWRKDIAEMTRDLSRARNPPALLVVMLGNLEKEINPNALCFSYRSGTCTWGDKCRFSHNIATGAERMNSRDLIQQEAMGGGPMPSGLQQSSNSSEGFGTSTGGFGTSTSSKVDKLLRRKRDRSSSSDRNVRSRRSPARRGSKWD